MKNVAVRHYSPEPALRHPLRFLGGIFHDLVSARELAWQLLVRDLRANYRQSLLGYVWAFLPPLAWAAMFLVLNAQGLVRGGHTDEGYATFVLAGMVLWHVFADALVAPLRAITQARSLLARVKFPPEALLLAALGEVAIQFLVRTPLLAWVWGTTGVPEGQVLAKLCIGVVSLGVVGASLGVLLLPLGLLYQDVGRGLALVVSFWLLVTPVAYQPPAGGAGAAIVKWNPVSTLIITTREWCFGVNTEAPASFIAVSVIGALLLACGWILFRIALPHAVARLGS